MDKKNKIFFVVFFGAIFLSIFGAYYKYFISQNYFIQAQTVCDPEKEACFVYVCDPEVDEDCPEADFERASYYKLIKKKAYLIPPCDPKSEHCPPLECGAKEDCEETLCSEDLLEEGVICNDPDEYMAKKIEAEEAENLNDEAISREEDGEACPEGECKEGAEGANEELKP